MIFYNKSIIYHKLKLQHILRKDYVMKNNHQFLLIMILSSVIYFSITVLFFSGPTLTENGKKSDAIQMSVTIHEQEEASVILEDYFNFLQKEKAYAYIPNNYNSFVLLDPSNHFSLNEFDVILNSKSYLTEIYNVDNSLVYLPDITTTSRITSTDFNIDTDYLIVGNKSHNLNNRHDIYLFGNSDIEAKFISYFNDTDCINIELVTRSLTNINSNSLSNVMTLTLIPVILSIFTYYLINKSYDQRKIRIHIYYGANVVKYTYLEIKNIVVSVIKASLLGSLIYIGGIKLYHVELPSDIKAYQIFLISNTLVVITILCIEIVSNMIIYFKTYKEVQS